MWPRVVLWYLLEEVLLSIYCASRDQVLTVDHKTRVCTPRHSHLFWQLPALAQWNRAYDLTPLLPQANACPNLVPSPARLLWAELGLPSQLSGVRMMFPVPLAWLSLGDS